MGKAKLVGMEDINKAFAGISDGIKNAKIQAMLRAASQPIIDAAKSKVPVETGDLRNAIGFITGKDAKYSDRVLIGVDTKFYHWYLAVMHEFGAPSRIQKTTGRATGSLPARPFMRPAIDANAERVITSVISGMETIIEQQAKKNNLTYK